ncbi:MAG: hypothetical protein CVT67_00250 [Actinobacteria bacterium HGW-Actinobacteria-7]|nr:MAG: hypothetical protein CVT67_00250 [Actinobacteria bacterium HGW-Actinobacteria-7]
MTSVNERIKLFFDEMATDVVEERVIEYVVREVHNGRRLMEVIDDPYVRNRLSEDKLAKVLENSEIIEALEQEIRSSMNTGDFTS